MNLLTILPHLPNLSPRIACLKLSLLTFFRSIKIFKIKIEAPRGLYSLKTFPLDIDLSLLPIPVILGLEVWTSLEAALYVFPVYDLVSLSRLFDFPSIHQSICKYTLHSYKANCLLHYFQLFFSLLLTVHSFFSILFFRVLLSRY